MRDGADLLTMDGRDGRSLGLGLGFTSLRDRLQAVLCASAERLHALALAVKDDLQATGVVATMQHLRDALQNQVNAPQEPSCQQQVSTALQQLAALQRPTATPFAYLGTTSHNANRVTFIEPPIVTLAS